MSYKYGFEKKGYNRDNFSVRSPVKTFRGLEVYQIIIKFSNLIQGLDFLKDEKNNLKELSESVPRGYSNEIRQKFPYLILTREILNKCLRDFKKMKIKQCLKNKLKKGGIISY